MKGEKGGARPARKIQAVSFGLSLRDLRKTFTAEFIQSLGDLRALKFVGVFIVTKGRRKKRRTG